MGTPVVPVDRDGRPFEDGNPLHVTGSLTGGDVSVSAIGAISDAPWDGTSPPATVIALLKRIALNTDTQ